MINTLSEFAHHRLRISRRDAQQTATMILSGYSNATELYLEREEVAERLIEAATAISVAEMHTHRPAATAIIESQFRCYAGLAHLRHGPNAEHEFKILTPGYAEAFHQPTVFPERMEEAARRSNLIGKERTRRKWMNGQPRIILIGDMGDIFSSTITFEGIQTQIITPVQSKKGRRHIWLLPTRNVERMKEFSWWLADRDIKWPPNLVAMTSISGQETSSRAKTLQAVLAPRKAIWAQPMWGLSELDLSKVDWLIVGGDSGNHARPFDVRWMGLLQALCQQHCTPLFLSQIGSRPMNGDDPLALVLDGEGEKPDPYGRLMHQWPAEVPRVREFPQDLRSMMV